MSGVAQHVNLANENSPPPPTLSRLPKRNHKTQRHAMQAPEFAPLSRKVTCPWRPPKARARSLPEAGGGNVNAQGVSHQLQALRFGQGWQQGHQQGMLEQAPQLAVHDAAWQLLKVVVAGAVEEEQAGQVGQRRQTAQLPAEEQEPICTLPRWTDCLI